MKDLPNIFSPFFQGKLFANIFPCPIIALYGMLKSLFVAVKLILNCMVIIACSIITFSNCFLN